jgi:hypothetical protein
MAGFEPRPLGPVASALTTTPPRRHVGDELVSVNKESLYQYILYMYIQEAH